MRRVKFPFELDVLDLVTPELKEKLLPLNDKLKEVQKERDERRKVRRKTKDKAIQDAASKEPSTSSGTDAVMESTSSAEPVPGTIEDEPAARKRETEALAALIHPDLAADVGCSPHGLYELCGIVTHKGASAEGGHYIGWVRKDAIDANGSGGGNSSNYDDPKDEWYKFDDDKVSVVKQERIQSLEGGGEDSVAYILLYRSKSLA